MTSRRTVLSTAVLAGALALPAPALAQAAEPNRTRHSSDGVVGPIAPTIPANARIAVQRTTTAAYDVAPGVAYTSWDEVDARGPIRAHLLTVRYDTPGLQLDYAHPSEVAATAPVASMIDPLAVAAVNGDFFDISDTGAPLGVGKQRGRGGLMHAPREGWNSAFYVGGNGTPRIGTLPLKAKIKQHPRWPVTNLNSPSVPMDGIGIYNQRWGRTSGYRVTDGVTTKVVQVVVRKGRVVHMKRKLSTDQKIKGLVLVGRGLGAQQLATFSKGDRLKVTWRIASSPKMAITGNKFLLQDGVRVVVDDREMHPRTAIGISRDTGELFILVVDGRQSFSRGYTMVELANLMTALGAEDALNLDGGGSSTMISGRPDGTRGVLNSPSDGFERSVANALEVLYSP
jgi:hypothetical protein